MPGGGGGGGGGGGAGPAGGGGGGGPPPPTRAHDPTPTCGRSTQDAGARGPEAFVRLWRSRGLPFFLRLRLWNRAPAPPPPPTPLSWALLHNNGTGWQFWILHIGPLGGLVGLAAPCTTRSLSLSLYSSRALALSLSLALTRQVVPLTPVSSQKPVRERCRSWAHTVGIRG
jgi:hypothetical protein